MKFANRNGNPRFSAWTVIDLRRRWTSLDEWSVERWNHHGFLRTRVKSYPQNLSYWKRYGSIASILILFPLFFPLLQFIGWIGENDGLYSLSSGTINDDLGNGIKFLTIMAIMKIPHPWIERESIVRELLQYRNRDRNFIEHIVTSHNQEPDNKSRPNRRNSVKERNTAAHIEKRNRIVYFSTPLISPPPLQ